MEMDKALELARDVSVMVGRFPAEPVARRWVFRAGMINGPILAILPLGAQTTALEKRCRSPERQPWAQSCHSSSLEPRVCSGVKGGLSTMSAAWLLFIRLRNSPRARDTAASCHEPTFSGDLIRVTTRFAWGQRVMHDRSRGIECRQLIASSSP
jgi:hypothetical protein